jgi:branched-chain amino acid transport system permease protein/urea transport system permease protein
LEGRLVDVAAACGGRPSNIFIMEKLVVTFLNGLTLTMILSLIALGLAVIFGLRGVINLAHGEFFMLGAYAVVAADLFLPSFWGGFVVAPLAVAGLGWVVERSIIRHLYDKPLDTLLATWGLSIVLREVVRLTIGAGYRYTSVPFSGKARILGADYPLYRFFIIGLTAAVFMCAVYFFLHTRYGLQIRASIADRDMAGALGINTSRVDQVVFALGSGMAGLAGAIMSPIVGLNPNMGIDFFAKTFMVVIVGGVGTLYGTLGGSVLIGGGESVLSTFIRPIIAQAFILLFAIIIIRFRPQGLFQR